MLAFGVGRELVYCHDYRDPVALRGGDVGLEVCHSGFEEWEIFFGVDRV